MDRTAAALHDNGFAPGDRIALLAHNCWQYAVLVFATARAGVVLMFTAEEISYILGHSRVSGFVVEGAPLAGRVPLTGHPGGCMTTLGVD